MSIRLKHISHEISYIASSELLIQETVIKLSKDRIMQRSKFKHQGSLGSEENKGKTFFKGKKKIPEKENPTFSGV